MSGVRLDQLVILAAVVLVASGGTFGWSKSGFGETGKQGAPPPRPSQFVQTADSRTSPSATSIESDEVPNSAFVSNKTSAKPHQAASTEGDEVPNPAAVAPPSPEISPSPTETAPVEAWLTKTIPLDALGTSAPSDAKLPDYPAPEQPPPR